jgi:hypothetical protein
MRGKVPEEVLRKESFHIEKVISGGQTGVDRAALDVALEFGIPCGGWCPKGRKAEDGPIDKRYPLQETASTRYRIRTEKNVIESDGTLMLTWALPKGGTALTIKFAQRHKKPYCIVDLSVGGDPNTVKEWAKINRIRVLNVAGPAQSDAFEIYGRAVTFLKSVLNRL